jgi:RNA polymerase sigma-70 factor (ECF subfamily)
MSQESANAFVSSDAVSPDTIAPGRHAVYSADRQNRPMLREFFTFDEQYVRRLTAGDPDTETHFADYFSGLLRAKLHLRLRSAQDVEDLLQEVFVRVLQSLRGGPGLQHPGKLGAFVNAVCNYVVLEHVRGKARVSQWTESTPEPSIGGADAERELLSREVREQVRTVLDELPAKDRGLLRAVFLDERDKDAVCRDYGIERAYLRVLLHRARRRLRDLLTNSGTLGRAAVNTSGGTHI